MNSFYTFYIIVIIHPFFTSNIQHQKFNILIPFIPIGLQNIKNKSLMCIFSLDLMPLLCYVTPRIGVGLCLRGYT